jgi:energy-coupling factor transport system permease protein
VTDLLYLPGQGLLYRLDPRAKVLFTIMVTAYLAFEANPTALLAALALIQALALFSPVTRRRQPGLWRTMAPLLAIMLALGGLRWRPPEALIAVGPIALTAPALWTITGMTARIAGITIAFSLMAWTTPPGDAVAALTRLGVPFSLAFPVIVILEYVGTFRNQFEHILEAQQSRGLTFPRRNPVGVARAYIPVLAPLLITALRTADTLTLALLSRGFGAPGKRTTRRTLRAHPRDWVFVLLTAAIVTSLALI